MALAKTRPNARVLIAEDEIFVAEACTYMINHRFKKKYGLHVVGCANMASQTIEMVKQLSPDIVLLDWYMPGCPSGAAEVVEEYIKNGYTGKTLVFTCAMAYDVIQDIFACGAHGYLWKNSHAELVPIALRQILDLGYYHSEWTMKAINELNENKPKVRLNAAQKAVLVCMSEGLKTPAIARKVNRDEHHVENRRNEILKILNADSSPHAIAIAIDRGILPGRLVFNEQEFVRLTGSDLIHRKPFYEMKKRKQKAQITA